MTDGLPFFTVCAYSTSCFHPGEPDLWDRACAQHGALSPGNQFKSAQRACGHAPLSWRAPCFKAVIL
jgi:hypothetical protein